MQFWKLTRPSYDGEYAHAFINGVLEHPFGLPGVECSVCKQTWGGSRVLPLEFPPALRHVKFAQDQWPITDSKHRTFRSWVATELRNTGQISSELQPGDTFQPCYLDIPSFPQADFLWSSPACPVVSARIRALLETLEVEHVSFASVNPRKVGSLDPSSPPPIPLSGEPDDILYEVPLLPPEVPVPPYFEMIVETESRYHVNAQPTSTCAGCGRVEVPDVPERLTFIPEMWTGAEIFYLASTLHIVVTDRVRLAIEQINATNVVFSEF